MALKRHFRRRSWQSIISMTRPSSGGAQGNDCRVETAVHSPTKQETEVIGMVLKALNDLKSDMGTVKKALNISNEWEYRIKDVNL